MGTATVRSRMLRDRRGFTSLFQDGTFVRARGMNLVYRRHDQSGHVAICVSKNMGTAVTRNRLRRIVREALEPQMEALPEGYDLAFLPAASFDRQSPRERVATVGALLRRVVE